jgi:hypothetical protein
MPDNARTLTFSYSDPNCRQIAKEHCDRLRITPNELWFNASTNVAALLIKQSGQYAEYALSQTGLDYVHKAEQEGRIAAGIMVLVQRDGIVGTIKPIAKMVADLNSRPPREGPYGRYWWINADGTPYTPHSGPGSLPPLSDIPF